MAASPVSVFSVPPEPPSRAPAHRKRGPYMLSEKRLAANRRNAERSTGPRSKAGKVRVARNAVKHGVFVDATRWRPEQHGDFVRTLDGLREDFHPQNARESGLVAAMADSYVRMAALLRYENLAALAYHQQCERELEGRIATATPEEAARLEAHREELRAAGLWGPTLPSPGETMAILRCECLLNRILWNAIAELESGRKSSIGADERNAKIAKTNPFAGIADECPEPRRTASGAGIRIGESEKTNPFDAAAGVSVAGESVKTNPLRASASNGPEALRGISNGALVEEKIAKTNPFEATFIGNRHERRRAEALARRQARSR